MFVFDNVLTAGTVLVRQQIESQNWEPSGHTDGWYIGSDGSASFFNVNLHGDLQSVNYAAGLTGYKLTYATGNAELNDLVARGQIATDIDANARVVLTDQGGFPRIMFFVPSAPNATFPGQIRAAELGSLEFLQLSAPVGASGGQAALWLQSPDSAVVGSGDGKLELFDIAEIDMTDSHNNELEFWTSLSGNAAILAQTTAGVARTLALNQNGGAVTAGGAFTAVGTIISGTVASANVNMNFNQIWALNNGAAAGLFLNFSSAGTVQIGNGTAAGADLLCVAMRPVKASLAGPGGTIVSTAFVSSNALGTTFTVPASGNVRIDYSGRMSIVTGATAQRAFMGIQVQSNNSAGPVIYATTDTESCEIGLPASISGNAGIYTTGKGIDVTGLTPGATIFVVITNRVTAATTSVTVTNAQLTVTPMP